ncbi:MAG: hypothetical protein P8L85_02155 [Rubripirellula sp.]|nr:hypothetical protein [Rubripirellula sp.]
MASISLGDHAKVATTAVLKSLEIQALIELERFAAKTLGRSHRRMKRNAQVDQIARI